MTETEEMTLSGSHLVVLLHGLFGFSGHLSAIREGLEKQNDGTMEYLEFDSYNGWDSYVGIDTIAFAVFEEIKKQLHPNERRHISIIGYSMGGLIGRFVIGLLQLDGCLGSQLIPHNYISLATPHAGVLSGFWDDISWAPRFGRLLSKSHGQITMGDNYRKGHPLLLILCQGVFAEGLKKFNCYSYGNIQNDRRVPLESAILGFFYTILITLKGTVQLSAPETSANKNIPEEEVQLNTKAPSKDHLHLEDLPPPLGKLVLRRVELYVKASYHKPKQAPLALTDADLGIGPDSSPKKSPKEVQDWIMQQEARTNLLPVKIAVRNPDENKAHRSIVGREKTMIGERVTKHVVELFSPGCQPPLGLINNDDSAVM